MAIIKAGTYRFNDVLSAFSGDTEQSVSFTTNLHMDLSHLGYGIIESVLTCSSIRLFVYEQIVDGDTKKCIDVYYTFVSSNPDLSAFGFTFPFEEWIYNGENGGNKWAKVSTSLQTITIPTDTEVSEEFYTWFNANAVSLDADKPLATITYNGSTIATLDGGQSATLKCKGMKMESDVVVEVAEQTESESGGGGASLNIAYGDTEPTDTSKLWVKADEPSKVSVGVMEGGAETLNLNVGALPIGAHSIGCASVGTKIYLFGGYGGSYLDTINVFDTETNETNTLSTTLSSKIANICAVAVGTKIYLFGGETNTKQLNTLDVFDTETNELSTLSTTLPTKAYGISAVAIGNKVYLFGGRYTSTSTTKYVNTVSLFDAKTNTINTIATLPTALHGIGTALVGTKIYLFGGSDGSGAVDTIAVFDTETYSITTLSAILPTKTFFSGTASVGTKIYMFGGQITTAPYSIKTINVFNTETSAIETLSITLPIETRSVGVASVGTKIYLFGGYGSSYLNTIHEFVVAFNLENGKMLITNGDNLWQMLNTDTVTAEIGVKDVYIGNADGVAEKVPSALYKDGAWVEL